MPDPTIPSAAPAPAVLILDAPTPVPAHSDWSPLRNHVFLSLWLAAAVSFVGFEIRNYAAPLLMLDFKKHLGISSSMAAYTQTASFLPIFLLVLLAGALADVLDRRKLLIVMHIWITLVAGALGLLTMAHLMTPWLLLGFLFLIGVGFAVNNPVYLAVLPELVERKEVRSALALNGVSLNIARVLGPALGGAIIYLVGKRYDGKGAAFLATAISMIGVILVLWRWKPAVRLKPAHPESVARAIRTGFRYAWFSPRLRAILIRVFLFIFFAGTLFPFAAIIGRDNLKLTDGLVAVMMVCLGIGAIVGVYFMQAIQRGIGIEPSVAICSALYGLAMLGVAAAPSLTTACATMLVAGFNWVIVPTNFNIATQLAVPAWVKGRALSMYVLVLYGSMAAGPAVFGKLSNSIGPRWALAYAAGGVLVGMIAILWFRLTPRQAEDFTPSKHWPKPIVAAEPDAQRGPVMVNIEYQIDPLRGGEFSAVMHELRLERLRDGANHWSLWYDAAVAGRYIETFIVHSWAEHLRLHERTTRDHAAVEARARAFHLPAAPPAINHFIHAHPPAGGQMRSGLGDWALSLLDGHPSAQRYLVNVAMRLRNAWRVHQARCRRRDGR